MRTLLCGLIITFWSAGVYAQSSFKVAFWNVENLFDTTNAVLVQDEEFTPTGKKQWTEERLLAKLQSLSKVIHHLNQDNDLALLGLSEVENRAILDRLNDDFLSMGMKVVHKESPDERGIDCGILYDPKLLSPTESNFLPVFLAGDEKTRDIIEAIFKPAGMPRGPHLYVYVNHWPSRWGGQKQTDPLRRAAARTLRTRIDNILSRDPEADILIIGDFNDYPDDPSLYQVLRAHQPGVEDFPGDLINTTWELDQDPKTGTCMYRGTWTVLDQIIISKGLMDGSGYDWQENSTVAFIPEYLIESSGEYEGWPFRMYRRDTYQGGYSDHLPVWCTISIMGN